MKVFVAKKQEKLSKMILREFDGGLSFSRYNKLLRNKDIKINGKRVNSDCVLSVGDEVTVYFDGEIVKIQPDILFEDNNLLVVIKPKNITSEKFFESLKQVYSDLFFCHRLDRNTDGVMVFSKNQKAYESIFNGFKEKTFEKKYIATVYGTVEKDCDKLIHYLVKDEVKSKVEVFDTCVKNSKKAILLYKVVERKADRSILEISLLTGRTHQIRAQLSKIGHFVLGDGKYGNDEINKSLKVENLMLTSKSIIFHFKSSDFLQYLDGKMIEIKK